MLWDDAWAFFSMDAIVIFLTGTLKTRFAHAYAFLRHSDLMEFMLAALVINLTVIAGWVFKIKGDQELIKSRDHLTIRILS
ncbi:hypothetical protein WG66_016981 [Moniliophthora roreri]|nr:hypothetical protein WG66_016981 [Moniliophthora roreri]